jgi:hypothetical protein
MKTRVLIVIVLAALLVSACARQLEGGAMEYSTAFERNIQVGQSVPGTDIKYVGKTDQGAQVSIGGQVALKRVLDSLDWRGNVTPDVNVDYKLRVLTFDTQSLKVGGTAKITASKPQPRAVASSAVPKDAPTFTGAVTYDVQTGKTIPGTTMVYEGKTADGAKLGGIEGYAFRKEADSILWTGQLADRVILKLDLRVLLFDDKSLKTTGTATLHITP